MDQITALYEESRAATEAAFASAMQRYDADPKAAMVLLDEARKQLKRTEVAILSAASEIALIDMRRG